MHWYYYVDGDTIEYLWEILGGTDGDDAPEAYKPLLDELNRIADTVNPW